MSDPITMTAMVFDPEALTTVAELRQALHHTNDVLRETFEILREAGDAAVTLHAYLNELLSMHMRGDSDALAERLTQLVERHVRMAHKASGGVH